MCETSSLLDYKSLSNYLKTSIGFLESLEYSNKNIVLKYSELHSL